MSFHPSSPILDTWPLTSVCLQSISSPLWPPSQGYLYSIRYLLYHVDIQRLQDSPSCTCCDQTESRCCCINYDGPELSSADELLREVSKFWTMSREVMFANKRRFVAESRQALFQSFKDIDKRKTALVPYNNGFVNGMIRAFQQDLHLVLRADDMWLTIMISVQLLY